TEIEKLICRIYSETFNINENEIGKMNDFYELGGDSLNAIRVSSKIEKELNIKINIKDILSNSVVCDLSKFIENILNNDKENYETEIIKKYNKKEFPITSQQLGVYIDSIKNSNSIIYNIPYLYKFKRNIDVNKIKAALIEMFNEQEIFKSKYNSKEIEGQTEVYGFIDDECSLEFEEYTYENAKSFVRPFDLSEAPLIRVGFINDEILLIDMHHIISDGMTMSIISKYLNNYYNDVTNEKLEIQFSDYAINLNEKKKEFYFEKQIEFYREIFENEEYDVLNIPKKEKSLNEDYEDENGNIAYCYETIDNNTSELINNYIKNYGLSKTAFFLTIYGYVLSKYSGQDIIYSSIIGANRNSRYIENMIGMFVSTQPILLKYKNENETFIEKMKQNMNYLMNIYSNQDVSFSQLIKELKLERVNNLFVYQPREVLINDDEGSIFSKNNSEEDILNLGNKNNNTKFDFMFTVHENKTQNYYITVEYDKEIYESTIMNNIIKSFIEVIKNVDSYNQKINEIEYIPVNEKERILNEFNSDINNYECDKLYHVEFSKIAKQYPERNAIVCNEVKISYGQLEEMSNSLAHYLRECGITRNDIVPIISERSHYYIIGTLAISKAGGAFLPVDKKLPIDRIEYILEEVNPKIILFYNTQYIIEQIGDKNYHTYNLENHNYDINNEYIDNINE
ncbi:hypothetical protein PIROE2DRAFT_9693, partial [Piromyces sp. E2]